MLKSKRRWLLALLMLAPLGQSPEVHATVGDVTINIPGCVTNMLNPPVNFTQNCPNFTISMGNVVMQGGDGAGGSQDILKFTGIITAINDVSQAEIKIARVFNWGPNSPPNVYYRTCANGFLTQDPNRTNSFTLTGSVNPVGQLPLQMGGQIYYSATQNTLFTCATGSALTTGQWPTSPALTGDRSLQATLFISLKATGILDLSAANLRYIQIRSQSSPDEFPAPPGTGSPGQSSCGGLFTQCTTHSTSRLFSSSSEDVVMSDDAKAKAFAGSCWQNLTSDIARSGGEYLSSLASLLKVQPKDQLAFVALAQAHYAMHQEQGTLVPEAFVEGLRDEILATPHMAKVATYVGH